jgi:hypothetical protein
MFDKTFEDFFHEVNGPIWILIGLLAARAVYKSLRNKDYVHAAAFVPVLAVALYMLFIA